MVIIRKEKTGIALFLYGDHGSGKGLIFSTLLGALMGAGEAGGAFKYIQGLALLVGRFNGTTGNRLLICGDEVDARTKRSSGTLKSMITEKTRNVEKKGKEVQETNDVSNLVITTNDADAIMVEETDRRYFIQEIPLPAMGVEERIKYFDTLSDVCEDPLYCPEFYVWLKNTVENDRGIMAINLRSIPVTQAKLDRMNDDQHPMYQWLQERYMNSPSWVAGDTVVQHVLYTSFCGDERFGKMKTTPQTFTKMFKKIGFEEGPSGRGRCWKMMTYEDFKAAMIATKKWNSNL